MQTSGVITRRITGIGIGLSFLAMWYFQGWVARVMLTVLGVLAVWEMVSAIENKGAKPVRAVSVIYMALCLPFSYLAGMSGLFALTCVTAMVGLCISMFHADVETDSAAMTLFPIIYPGMLFAVLIDMTRIEPKIVSTLMMGFIYGATMLNDIMAYEIGTLYGKRKMAPVLSPKKTWEGSIAGEVTSVIMCALMPYIVRGLASLLPMLGTYEPGLFPPIWLCALFGLISGAAAQAGDLCASMVKRYCGIKDYGTLFPGHGGVMDRMDGILFSGLCASILFVVIMR